MTWICCGEDGGDVRPLVCGSKNKWEGEAGHGAEEGGIAPENRRRAASGQQAPGLKGWT